jgi:hypothetical protein
MHFINTFLILLYIVLNYHSDRDEEGNKYVIMLAVGVLYPTCYEIGQVYRGGIKDYLMDTWNYADMTFVAFSLFNIYSQIYLGAHHILSRAIMCLIVVQVIIRTFFYMRIF